VDAAKQVAAAVVSAVQKVVTVIVTTAEKVVNAVGETVNKVEAWVIDTAEKAGAFVEGVVEKIGVEAKKLVEYLRSLFDWKDILSTQRYLADAIDIGLGYAVKLADDAKEPVNNFISALRQAANDGLDQTINDLKKDTQSVGGQPQLPEELEWLLSKLTANSTPSTTVSNTPQSVSSSDPLESFFSTFMSGSKSVVDMLLELLKGLGKTIATLILNPSHPQLALIAILEMVRSVTNHALDFINTIAIGFLDCVELAVGKFRTLINADINIPFLKALFRIIGINRLSLLNIATLLIAIPVTITSKLIFGRKPFREPRLAQSIQEEFGDGMSEVGDGAIAAFKALSSPNDKQSWAIAGFVCDAINGLITGLLDGSALKHIFFEGLSKILSCTSWLASFPASPKNSDGQASPKNSDGHFHDLQGVSESDGAPYWERVMWGWRTSVFGINLITFLFIKAPLKRGTKADGSKGDIEPNKAQGFVKEAMPVLCMLFAAIDIGISAKYLVSSRGTKSNHEEGMRQSAEYVGIFPSILAPLNYSKDPCAAIALGAIDVACAAVVSGLKGDMLRKDYKTLGQS
jgi:hypothetical protein